MMNVRGEIMRDALAPHPAYTRGGDTHAPRWQARSLPVRDVMSPPPLAIGIDAAQGILHSTFGIVTYAVGTVTLVGLTRLLR